MEFFLENGDSPDSPDLIFSTRSTSKTWGAIFMNLTPDDSRIFPPIFISLVWPMVNIGKQILESLRVKFINSAPYVFDVDRVAKIRSGLSITVLEKKFHIIIVKKVEEYTKSDRSSTKKVPVT